MGLNVCGFYVNGAILIRFICIYVYNLAWGGLKKGKNGGDPYGFYLVFAFHNFVVFIQRILNFVVPLSLFYVPGDFLSYSALFY